MGGKVGARSRSFVKYFVVRGRVKRRARFHCFSSLIRFTNVLESTKLF